jgi:hypothetical protein
VALVGADGSVFEVTPVFSGSNARLFQKAAVLECFVIAMNPDEAGPDNKWLIQLGSRQFAPFAHTDKDVADWIKRFCNSDRARKLDPREMPYHTLPYFFERPTFMTPSDPPPWSADMLEDSFVRNLSVGFGGRAMCLSDENMEAWRKTLNQASALGWLKSVVPSVDFEATKTRPSRGGRPRLIDEVADAYARMSPEGRRLSWKERMRLVESELGFEFGMTTFKKAAKQVEGRCKDQE